jgi:hypothetical protein
LNSTLFETMPVITLIIESFSPEVLTHWHWKLGHDESKIYSLRL